MVEVFHTEDFSRIIDKIDPSRLGDRVGIKVHFGEAGCTTFLRPELAKKVYEYVKGLGKEAALIECNVLYVSDRTRASTHKRLAKKHGFDFAPIHILDGEKGGDYVEIDGCKIGKGIEDYDSLIVLSHFKGHMSAGFGGAAKNLGMGLGSRGGKLDMHAGVNPEVDKSGCVGCEACVKNCPVLAIEMTEGKAEIDPEKCIGCAMCISVCPQKTIRIPWGKRDLEGLQKRIREYALAIINRIGPDKMTYISVMENITRKCDCMGEEQEPIMADKGFLISNDMDAIDLAALEITDNIDSQVSKNLQNREVEFEIVEV